MWTGFEGNGYLVIQKTPVLNPLWRLHKGLLSPTHTQLSLYFYYKIHSKFANRVRRSRGYIVLVSKGHFQG